MKYCPQCKRQFDEPWLSFCPDDGTPLIQELTPPRDPNWDPNIREPGRETKVDNRSEQETQWFPRQPPMPGGWIAPDERPPMNPPVPAWQPPPPPPYRPNVTGKSQGLALASMITAIAGLVFGFWCFGPLPGIAAVIMGAMALSQIKKTPDKVTGKPFATAGIVIGAVTIVFYLLIFLWFLFGVTFGSFG
jgi:hypothetical protein